MFALDVSGTAEAGVEFLGVALVPAGLRRDDCLALLHVLERQLSSLCLVAHVARSSEHTAQEARLRRKLVRPALQSDQTLRLPVLPTDALVQHLK